MVAIARAIIKQRTETFDPRTYRDRYQEALQELIEAMMKGAAVKPREVSAPPPVIDLMAALKRSLAQQAPATKGARASREKRTKAVLDRRQPSLLLPVSGGRKSKEEPAAEPVAVAVAAAPASEEETQEGLVLRSISASHGLSCRRLFPLVRDGSFSHFVFNRSGFQVFGDFVQLGGPNSELFDNFRFDLGLPQIATSPCQITKIV